MILIIIIIAKKIILKPLLKPSTNQQAPKQYQATVQVSTSRMFTVLLQTSLSTTLSHVSFHTPMLLCCKCPLHCRSHVCSLIWGNMDVREVQDLLPHPVVSQRSLIREPGVSKLGLCFRPLHKGFWSEVTMHLISHLKGEDTSIYPETYKVQYVQVIET